MAGTSANGFSSDPSPRTLQQEGNGPWDSRATMVMAPEVKFDFGIELSDLNYPDIMCILPLTSIYIFVASEGVGDNMHMDTRVFKVADLRSEVI